MAWLAVDKSGEEYIFVGNKPERMENHLKDRETYHTIIEEDDI